MPAVTESSIGYRAWCLPQSRAAGKVRDLVGRYQTTWLPRAILSQLARLLMATCSAKRASHKFTAGPNRVGRKEAMPAQHRVRLAGALVVVPGQPAGGGCAAVVQRQPAENHRGNPIAGPRSIPAVGCLMSADVVSHADTPGGCRAVAIIVSDDLMASAPSPPICRRAFHPGHGERLTISSDRRGGR